MKKIIGIFLLSLAALIITACSNTGIFYSLENEEKVLDPNNLKNNANFSNLVKAGSYYVGNGGINVYYRDITNGTAANDYKEDDWHAMALPTGAGDAVSGLFAADAVVTSMALVNTDLIISRISYDGSSIVSGIYRLANAATSLTSPSWEMIVKSTAVKGTDPADYYKLFSADNQLYINHLTYTYDSASDNSASLSSSLLYHEDDVTTIANNLSANSTSIDISSFAKNKDGSDRTAPVEKIVSSGTDYWLVINGETTGSVYRALNGAPTVFSSVTSGLTGSTSPAATRYVDIYEVSGDHVLITNTKGSLYIYDDTDTSFRELSKGSAFLNGFININTLETGIMLVGSAAYIGDSTYDADGYYQLNISSADDADWTWVETGFTGLNNYNSSELSSSTINCFLYDDSDLADIRIFACTFNEGVWKNAFDSKSGERRWTRE